MKQRRKKAILGLVCAGMAVLMGCGGGTPEPVEENALLREVKYTVRDYGEKESEDKLLRTVRFSVDGEGEIVKESFDGEGELYEKRWYTASGALTRMETYLSGEDGGETETDTAVYTLENGLCVKEETFRDGEADLIYTREYDEQGNLSYEQLYRFREGEKELQYTHHFASSYDENGNLVEQIYTCDEEPAQNTETRYDYDEKGNLIKQAEIRDGKEASATEYSRDERGNVLEERRFEDGVEQGVARYRYTYDGEGRILRTEDLTASPAAVTEYAYDEAGRCTRTVNSTDGREVTSLAFVYDYDGRFPRRIEQTSLQHDGDAVSGQVYTTVYTYDGQTTGAVSELLLSLAA